MNSTLLNITPIESKSRTQAGRTALSDERMFASAKQIIVEKGTHKTTLKEIGERAGYSRGLASNRFGSKEGLFSQMVRDFNRRWASELKRFVGEKTGLAAYIAAFDAVESFLLGHSEEMRALYILWFESMTSHDEVRRRLEWVGVFDIFERKACSKATGSHIVV